ncbi:MAG: phosphatidate cytidylyltransferase [Desulfovibrio sp.]|jgi:phosphatidate cytidylyltransferase|nr:phosphatidate cytidylyltransferase [Desulfovibrio sp.]
MSLGARILAFAGRRGALAGWKQRLITGILLLAVLASGLALGGWVFRLLLLGVVLAGLLELYGLFWPGRRRLPLKACGLLCGGGMILGQAFSPFYPSLFLVLGCAAAALAFLFEYGRGRAGARLQDYAPLVFGLVYIPFAIQLGLPLSTAEQALIIAAAVATDTGAYYAGVRFGRHKIRPAVSPKKSWEGAAGGLAACLAVCLLAGAFASGRHLPPLPLWGWACAGLGLSLAAQCGDFFESALKRSVDVKDSSALFPGHGGMLDRLDSILFVIPAYSLLRLTADLLFP